MVILFKLIILTVIIVMGLKIVMSKGMLFEKWGEYFERKVDEGHKWMDIFICPWCMNSIQSITAHLFALGLGIIPLELNWQLLIRLPLVICGASFISGNIWNLHETVNRIRECKEAETVYFDNLNNEDNNGFTSGGL